MPLKFPKPQTVAITELSLTGGNHAGTNPNLLKTPDPEQKLTEFPNNRDLIKLKPSLP